MRMRRRSGAAGCSAACSAEVGTVVSEQLRAYLTAAALGAAAGAVYDLLRLVRLRRRRDRRLTHGLDAAFLLLVILALVVFLGVELIRVGKRLNEAAQQQAALERQLQQQTQENQALESDLAKKDDEEFIKDLARDQLGLAEAGERIFYDVND